MFENALSLCHAQFRKSAIYSICLVMRVANVLKLRWRLISDGPFNNTLFAPSLSRCNCVKASKSVMLGRKLQLQQAFAALTFLAGLSDGFATSAYKVALNLQASTTAFSGAASSSVLAGLPLLFGFCL